VAYVGAPPRPPHPKRNEMAASKSRPRGSHGPPEGPLIANLARCGVSAHHPKRMNRAVQSAPGRWTMPPPPSTKSPASGDAGSYEVGQATGNASQPRHADEDGVSHVRDPEPLRRRACRFGAAAKRGRRPCARRCTLGSQADASEGRRRGGSGGGPSWPPCASGVGRRRTARLAQGVRPGCWSGPASDLSTPTIWPRWPSAAAWNRLTASVPLTDGGIEDLA
jgi:hypothetical protein